MKNIFCLFLATLLSLSCEISWSASHMSKSDGTEPEKTGQEVLIDSSAMRHRENLAVPASANAVQENGAKKPVFENGEEARKELAKFMENDGALSGDAEVIKALGKMADSAAKKPAPAAFESRKNSQGDSNLYGKQYGLSDVEYFPSRRRSKTIQ